MNKYLIKDVTLSSELEQFLVKHLTRAFILDSRAVEALTKITNLSVRNGREVYCIWPKLLDWLGRLATNPEEAKRLGIQAPELSFRCKELLVRCKFRRRTICFPVKLIMRSGTMRQTVRRLRERGVITRAAC